MNTFSLKLLQIYYSIIYYADQLNLLIDTNKQFICVFGEKVVTLLLECSVRDLMVEKSS